MIVRFSTALLLLFAAIQCLAQAPAASDYSFKISGSQTWTDTGLDLAAGDVVSLTVEAKAGSVCDPKGSSASQGSDNLPLASAASGALIAKTSEQGGPTFIGAGGEVRAGEAGRLYLGVNQNSVSNCVFSVKASVAHAQNAASPAAPTGMRDKLSSAAQVFMKAQFGGKESGQSQSNTAAAGNAAMPGNAAPSTAGGLKLPSVILDADLRKNIDGVPRRIHDAKGNMGDMINFVMVGSQEKVQAALSAANWHVADVDSKEAGLKAVLNTYQKKDYLEMPMSHLYLWDRM